MTSGYLARGFVGLTCEALTNLDTFGEVQVCRSLIPMVHPQVSI